MHYTSIPENLGDKVYSWLEEFGHLVELFLNVFANIFRGKINLKLTFDQMVKIGIDSLPLCLTTAAFIGMVFAIQIAGEFVRFGAGRYVGGVMSIAMARELGPAITGIVVAARVAAAITAEIGNMCVTEQIDALRALGASTTRYLVVPRFIAAALMMPLLTIFADVLGFLGGFMVATAFGGINSVQYLETAQNLVNSWDIYGGIIKTIIFGAIIAVIACHRGLNTKGGAKGVGEATTSSVVTTLISLFIVNYFLSVLFFK